MVSERRGRQVVRNNLVTVSGLSPKTKERNEYSRAQEAQEGEIPKTNEYLTMQILRYEMSTQIYEGAPGPTIRNVYLLVCCDGERDLKDSEEKSIAKVTKLKREKKKKLKISRRGEVQKYVKMKFARKKNE
ncbi:hypothetical protein RUM44_012080 [Polyplax serrata]|uniref:Uncharacterized protein n=1 Tax=Polyplax serrata TaxID=468196 RepID=A0ABR1BAM0_POLSC